MNAHESQADAGRRELIAFRMAGQEFCVDIMSVREIRGWTAATPLPHAPQFVSGVINLRGAVLPIVDLGERLGLGATQPDARHVIIVAHIGTRLVGLLVEAVLDILTVPQSALQATPDVACEVARRFVRNILPVEDRMISLISLDEVLPSPEAEAA
jgi:purine-binding chemotaxis protein CheW